MSNIAAFPLAALEAYGLPAQVADLNPIEKVCDT